MAFEDTGDEELDYENEDLLDSSHPGHPAMHGLTEEQLEDEDYEDLYGDVNVGMFQGQPAPQASAAGFRNSVQNGAPSYGDIDSGNEEDYPVSEQAEEPKDDLGDIREEGPNSVLSAKDKDVDYGLRGKQGNVFGELQPGPSSSLKPKDENDQGLGQPARVAPVPKTVKSTGGPNGTGGIEGAAGRGLRQEGVAPGGWPLGSGPAGGPGGNMAGGPTSNVASEYITKHTGQAPDSGGLMLFVGELQWWTTDAELEAALSEYGRVKNLKFFEEKASGKSKGYCQVEFFDSQAARVCKEKMDGRVFNGRACVVAFASPQTIKQMGAAQIGKNQAGPQSQGQAGQGKKMTEGGRGAGAPPPGGEGRGFNKGGRGGQSGMERGRGNQGPGRGRGRGMAPFGPQGPMGGPPGGMMPPQGMMGQGFEPGFGPPMGRGGGYGMGPGGGGFGPRGPPFSGMGPPFPPMGGLPGVPAHVNPAFFGRANGSGPGMGPGGMEGPPGGWGEVGMPGWEDHERRMREGGYAGEDMGGGEFGYGGEMGRVGPGRERERGAAEGEWGPERRRREERGGERSEEWERGERHRTGDREAYREQRGERSEREKEKDWDRSERPTSRGPREKDDDRVRSREDDHGKRRRMVTDRKAER